MNSVLHNTISPQEAAYKLLSIVWEHDLKNVSYRRGIFYIYFDVQRFRFSFETMQRRQTTGLLKAFTQANKDEVINIAWCKHSFCAIAIGAMNRKLLSRGDYLDLTQEKFEWFR